MKLDNQFSVHFIGICGSGMNVLAKYLKRFGFKVSGSDLNYGDVFKSLLDFGIDVKLGHVAKNVVDANVVVYSSAISSNNVELKEAINLRKTIYSRAKLLNLIISTYKNSIGIAGSHGKTTTTSMGAHVLDKSLIDYTAFIGGVDSDLNNFVYSDSKNCIITEVCEFNNNLKYVFPTVAVVLNIDNDHLDYFKTIDNLHKSFINYLDKANYKIICNDDCRLKNYSSSNLLSFAIYNDATYKAENLVNNNGKYSFSVTLKNGENLFINLNVYGMHNVYNALANVAIFDGVFNFDKSIIKSGIESFTLVKRRCEFLGKIANKNICADYCHHPSEIVETLKIFDEIFNKDYTIIFQPHTYSRTKLLFNEFIEVFKGRKIIIFKTYSAREKYDYTGSAKRLSRNLKCRYYKNVKKLKKAITIEKYTKNYILLGAGNLCDLILKENSDFE